jgi:chitin synthase
MDPSVSQYRSKSSAKVQCANSSLIPSYVKSAYGITDTPDSVPELISQRRRWLNGSFFAAIHATVKFGYIYRSDHSFIRKFWLHIELVYQLFQQLFAWFSLANYYISFVSCLPNSLQALLLYASG